MTTTLPRVILAFAVLSLLLSGCDDKKKLSNTALREQAMKEGMKPLRISGAMKVAAGVTTIDEVLKVAPPIRDAIG